jgi:MFS family permease
VITDRPPPVADVDGAPSPPSHRPPTYRPMRERDFRIYWFGGFGSNIGTWLQNVAASVYIMSLTGSSLWVGYLNFATFAPLFLFGLWGGVLSDRMSRRRIVTVTHGVAVVVSLVLAAMTFAGVTTPAILLVAAFLLGSCYSLAKPTLSAILPAIVPSDQLSRATAVNTFQFNLGQLIGSALATVFLMLEQPGWAFALNGLTFLGPIVAMRLIELPRRGRRGKSQERGLRALSASISFIRVRPAMVAMLAAIVLTNTGTEALRTLAPGLASGALRLDEAAAGYIVTAYSVGAAGGLLLFTWLSAWIPERRLMYAGFVLQGLGVGLLAVAPNLPLAVAAAVPVGIGFTWLIPALNAGLLRSAPEQFRGRVASSFAMAHLGLRPLWGLGAGALAAVIGERSALAVFVAGAVAGLAVLRLVRVPDRVPSG